MMKIARHKIIAALESNDLESVAAMAKEHRNVLSLLARLAYDKETLTGWRAIKAVGRAARVLLPIDYPFLHETVRKLLWSLSDESGGIGWSSPEMLGEIVCTDPHKFSDIIPLIAEVYDIEETHFRPGVLYALTNLGVAGALDAFTGEIRWLFKYNRIFSQDPDRYYRDYYLDTGGWKHSVPLLEGGRFHIAPEDSRFFYRLDMDPDPEGYVILDDPIEKSRYVSFIGTSDGRRYFTAREAGRNYLVATDGGGAVLWETPRFEVQDRVSGRPLLTGRAVWVPTERYLYRVDLALQGLITRMVPLPDPAVGKEPEAMRFGNILAIKDYLVSVSGEGVIVFHGPSREP